tara:strand:+ start:12 stop:185 length:174 start_codon:yes stop_codon:yes gene_type:complete
LKNKNINPMADGTYGTGNLDARLAGMDSMQASQFPQKDNKYPFKAMTLNITGQIESG